MQTKKITPSKWANLIPPMKWKGGPCYFLLARDIFYEACLWSPLPPPFFNIIHLFLFFVWFLYFCCGWNNYQNFACTHHICHFLALSPHWIQSLQLSYREIGSEQWKSQGFQFIPKPPRLAIGEGAKDPLWTPFSNALKGRSKKKHTTPSVPSFFLRDR